jgi:hypothetical protein
LEEFPKTEKLIGICAYFIFILALLLAFPLLECLCYFLGEGRCTSFSFLSTMRESLSSRISSSSASCFSSFRLFSLYSFWILDSMVSSWRAVAALALRY